MPGTTGSRGIGSFTAVVVRMPPLESTVALKLPGPPRLLDAPPLAAVAGGGAALRTCGWSPFRMATACGSGRTDAEALKSTLYEAQPSSGPAVFRCARTNSVYCPGGTSRAS